MLQIPRAQAEDSGRYICVAVNEAGEDSIHYDVRLLCEWEMGPVTLATETSRSWAFCPATVPPIIRGAVSDFPDEVTVLVNKTTQLECVADGNPTPKISWFQDSQPVRSDGPHRILSNGRILQVKLRSHPNVYRCL